VNTTGRHVSPREWIGDRPFPWPPTLGLNDGEEVVACFSVNQVTTLRTRSNEPFLKLQLADCYGVVEARMWEGVDEVADTLRPGVYIGVRGTLERYHEERQLRVEVLAPLAIELDDLVLFLPRSARPAEHMDLELESVVASVVDPGLHRLLQALLAKGTETGHAFRLAPAAKQNHHAYLGGLIEHTLSVTAVCDMLVSHYGSGIDRDLLIAGALLHDIGKVREIGARGGFPYTDEGKLLGHILIGLQMVTDAAASVAELHPARLLLLQHLIASHQGRYEWQSPREPRTLEAMILHYADDLDAKVNQAGSLIAAVSTGWTAYDRSLGRDFLRHLADDAPATVRPAEAAEPSIEGARHSTRAAANGTMSEIAPDPQRSHERTGTPTTPALDTLDLFDDT
jgi:3'-5' exoribonuclease